MDMLYLKNIINKKRINKINNLLKSLEKNKKSSELPHNVFWKTKINQSVIYLIF